MYHEIKKGDRSLSLENIIMQAGYDLAYATQWRAASDAHIFARSIATATAFIEIAEVMVCGSIGGFDSIRVKNRSIEQQNWSEANKYDKIFSRWLWLFTFYVGGKDDTPFSSSSYRWRNVGDLKEFYKRGSW